MLQRYGLGGVHNILLLFLHLATQFIHIWFISYRSACFGPSHEIVVLASFHTWINSCSEKSGLQHISMLKLTKSLIRWRKNVQKCYFSLAMFVFSGYLCLIRFTQLFLEWLVQARCSEHCSWSALKADLLKYLKLFFFFNTLGTLICQHFVHRVCLLSFLDFIMGREVPV